MFGRLDTSLEQLAKTFCCAILLLKLLSSHPQWFLAWIKGNSIDYNGFSCLDGSLLNTGIDIFKPCLPRLLLLFFVIHEWIKIETEVHCLLNDCLTGLERISLLGKDSLLEPLVSTQFNLVLSKVVQGSLDNLRDNLLVSLSFFEFSSCDVYPELCWVGLSCFLEHTLRILVCLKFSEGQPKINCVWYALHSLCKQLFGFIRLF